MVRTGLKIDLQDPLQVAQYLENIKKKDVYKYNQYK